MHKLFMHKNRWLNQVPESLSKKVLEGLVVNRRWLQEKEIARPDVDYYLRSGALKPVARGFYRRPGPPLPWQSITYSLQQMGFNCHVGGHTALDDQGYGHFLPLSGSRQVALYSADTLPQWLSTWHQDQPLPSNRFQFTLHKLRWLKHVQSDFLGVHSFGHWDWQMKYATAELALLELLVALESETNFQQLDRVFESLTSLRPKRVQHLLEVCPSIKARRLFGWFAERHDHAWFSKIDWKQINLGAGKRSVVRGGRYNSRWKITVPRNLEEEDVGGFE